MSSHDHDQKLQDEIREREIDAYMETMEEMIAKHGNALVPTQVENDNGELIEFNYTVGTEPVIMVFGLPVETSVYFLSVAAPMLCRGELKLDVPIKEFSNLPVMFKEVAPEAAEGYINIANHRAGGRLLPALQMVLSDPNGRFPWEEGFDHAMDSAQPLLYERHSPKLH